MLAAFIRSSNSAAGFTLDELSGNGDRLAAASRLRNQLQNHFRHLLAQLIGEYANGGQPRIQAL